MAGRDQGGGRAHVHQVKAGVCWQEEPWEHSSLHPYLTRKTGCQGSLQSARCAGGSPRIMGRRGGGPGLGLRMGLQRLAWEPCSALCLWNEAPNAWQGACRWPTKRGVGHPGSTCPCQERGGARLGQGACGSGAASNIIVLVPNREFNKEPELMPKTPSQKNRRKKRRVSYVQDENRDPIRKRCEEGQLGRWGLWRLGTRREALVRGH